MFPETLGIMFPALIRLPVIEPFPRSVPPGLTVVSEVIDPERIKFPALI